MAAINITSLNKTDVDNSPPELLVYSQVGQSLTESSKAFAKLFMISMQYSA